MHRSRQVRAILLSSMLSTTPALLPATLSATLFLGSAVAHAADVTLENLNLSDKGSTFAIKRVEVTDSNLDKSEIAKLFMTETKPEEAAAIVRKLKASKFSIPEILITDKDGFKGTLRDFVATNLNEGKVAKISVAGFDGSKADADGATSVKVGQMVMDNADLTKLLDAAKDKSKPDPNAASQAVDHMLISNVDVAVPADGVAATAPGGNLNRFRIAAIEGTNDKSALPKLRATFEFRNFVFEPVKGSSEAASINEYGYDKLDLGLKIVGTYDEAGKKLSVENVTFSGVDLGALGLKAEIGNYVKPKTGAPQSADQQAFLNATLASAQLSFVNSGMFEKAVSVLAKQQGKAPEAMKAEWSAIATAMLPAILGGDPAGKTIGDAVSKFIASPKSLTIGATAKGAPVKVQDLAGAKSPQDVLSKITVTASANQ